MTTEEVARALEEWAAEAASLTSSFDYPPEELSKALPLVIAEVKRKQRQQAPQQFQQQTYQQATVRVWTAEVVLLVSPDPAWTASRSLYTLVDTLESALYVDPTLGDRVGFADKTIDASFDPPEIEFSDGTVCRQATFNMTVGEYAEA
jgi:hypothetical protein